MAQYSEIIIKPILTEKTHKAQVEQNIYTFQVAKSAGKTSVKEAITKLFEVKVKDVNIVNVRAKDKKVGKYAGKKASYKKAYVKLMPGEVIGGEEAKEKK